jgi:hypothetical protein
VGVRPLAQALVARTTKASGGSGRHLGGAACGHRRRTPEAPWGRDGAARGFPRFQVPAGCAADIAGPLSQCYVAECRTRAANTLFGPRTVS